MNPFRRAVLSLTVASLVLSARAATPADVERAWQSGEYDRVIADATAGVASGALTADWSILLTRALLTVGRNADADRVMKEALVRSPQNIQLRWLAREVALANGRTEEAAQRPAEIRRIVASRPWNYRTPADLVVFGRAALLLGADPKDVLEKVYATAIAADPKQREAYLARGELALEKHDFALAARAFEDALKQLPDDPDLLCGRARAYASGEREVALESLQHALKTNPRHVPSLLALADHHVDAEAYAEAEKVLAEVVAINPTQPEAWAYRAVIAHVRNDFAAETEARATALQSCPNNPRVDYLIGKKLAQKYRFAEAAGYQRRARELDPAFLPASAELATDLLRLGEEADGWSLAQAVHERDDYDVQAYNLVTLRDTMKGYAALTGGDFVVRMASGEVSVYGDRVLALLRRAQQTLVAKYGADLARPTYVEIFADQKDFAVRTFGLPDVPGFLGVCFGRVVTANSPATSGTPTNWEAVLWHEFCHVVTLQLTKNKMPRWLSEGVSVYEERQADPAWGMRIDARSREMILGDDLVPVGKLSAAFLAPKTAEHLQFAYLESSLVVEFIVERFGVERLREILRDLGDGVEINAALARRTVPLPELEKGFTAFARGRAEQLAPQLDWTKPDSSLLRPEAAEAFSLWEKAHPDNYWALKQRSARLVAEENWTEARRTLSRLIALYPNQKGADAAYQPLVAALHALGDVPAERAALTRWVAVDDEATDGYLRLMELAAADGDWPTVARNADRYLAVNPLVAPPYRYAAQAATALGDVSGAVVAWRTLLQLDTPDPADAHYQLAQLLRRRGEGDAAKREVLLALEESPRYRDALRLLLELEHPASAESPTSALPSTPTGPAPTQPGKS